MKALTNISLFVILLVLASCTSYTRSLTKKTGLSADQLMQELKLGKTYVLELKNGERWRIKVNAIENGMLHGLRYVNKEGRLQKVQSSMPFPEIEDVKEARIDVIKTSLLVAVPVVLAIIAVNSIEFSLGGSML